MSDEGLEANIESSDFKAPMAGFGWVFNLPLFGVIQESRNQKLIRTSDMVYRFRV